ncbi:hypothetical protein [uncultured Winogradskyella sp.]|uniref:hypothetical protein n=1 Tax=uncultured Winogradskyella sp. TaxID=395353 RepID=UPI003518739F
MRKSYNTHKNFEDLPIMGEWIPREAIKRFFNYGNTKMASFAKEHRIRVSKIGKRLFYNYLDIVKLLDSSTLKEKDFYDDDDDYDDDLE